jgi:uncharacterized protein DUF350
MINNLLDAVAYMGVGLGLLVLGAWVVDLLTPGRLVTHIFPRQTVAVGPEGATGLMDFQSGSYSAALVLGAAMLGQGAVAFTTIWTNAADGFGRALGWTVAFGLLGILANAVAFLLVDVLTPGRLGEVVCIQGRVQPASVVTAAAQLAAAAIVVASIA